MEDGKKGIGEPNQNNGGEGVGGPRIGREAMRQDDALPDEERLREMLRKNHFCRGIGGRGGKRYRCGGEEINEEVRDRAVVLLSETVRRMVYRRVWNSWWIEEIMDEWLELRNNIEAQLGGRYDVNEVLRLVDGSLVVLRSYGAIGQRLVMKLG